MLLTLLFKLKLEELFFSVLDIFYSENNILFKIIMRLITRSRFRFASEFGAKVSGRYAVFDVESEA